MQEIKPLTNSPTWAALREHYNKIKNIHLRQLFADLELRPRLMVQTIEQLQNAHVEPDVWKIEGLDRREDCANVVAAVHRGGREKVGCIILGRGEDDKKVREWLTTAATVPGFSGFAVGRTDFWEPLVRWRSKQTTREGAVNEIARRYREFVDTFEKAQGHSAMNEKDEKERV